MFIPRAEPDTCTSPAGCPSPDADPAGSDTVSGFDPSLMNRPGAHRYIGIAMVAVLILIVFLVWLYRGNWPRRMLRRYCYCCCSNRSKELPKSIDIDDDREDSGRPGPTKSLEKDRRKSSPGNSEKRLVNKEVSGGMVVFTPVSKAMIKGKSRYPAEWEVEHANSIRLETRTPQRHNGSRQS